MRSNYYSDDLKKSVDEESAECECTELLNLRATIQTLTQERDKLKGESAHWYGRWEEAMRIAREAVEECETGNIQKRAEESEADNKRLREERDAARNAAIEAAAKVAEIPQGQVKAFPGNPISRGIYESSLAVAREIRALKR